MQRGLILSIALGLTACGESKPKPNGPASAAPASKAPASAAAAPESAAPATEAPPETVAPVKISMALDESRLSQADTLAADIAGGTFSRLKTRNPEFGELFLQLAAQHPSPKVVATALSSLARTWRRSARGDSPVINDDYQTVVRARLASKNGEVQAGALKAARPLLSGDPPDEAAFTAVLDLLGTDDPGAQVAACNVLISVRDFQLAKPMQGPVKARVVVALQGALGSKSPAVRAAVFEKLSRGAFPTMPHRDALAQAAQAALNDDEPAVRGAATLLHARLATKAGSAAAAKAIIGGLEHPNPYVKAATAEALGVLRYQPAAHGIIGLVSSKESAVQRQGGFEALKGGAGRVDLLLAGGRTVGDVALSALRAATGKAFDFSGGITNSSRADVIAAANAWYQKNKGRIPKE